MNADAITIERAKQKSNLKSDILGNIIVNIACMVNTFLN